MPERSGRDRLLATKLMPPPVPELVDRPRLMELLEGATCARLTLLCAPAGFGKSTLASTFAGGFAGAVAWLTLDESENDPDVFMDYVTEALAAIAPRIRLAGLRATVRDRADALDAFLAVALNEIAACPAPALFVLDDYHRIVERSVHRAVAFLLEHLPSNLRILIGSRADPPLPTAALRARGLLLEIRAAELCFTLAETGSLVNGLRSLGLSGAAVTTLHERTEGWIAGLELASATIRQAADPEAAVKAFAGSDRYVLDYLMDEAFGLQPPEVQEFLLSTSVLNRLCGPLCDAVTRGTGGSGMLRLLEEQNLFLMPLDSQRSWYRYHALFQDLLSLRLAACGEHAIAELHSRASSWLEGAGLAGEAISHALQARPWARAAYLVEKVADATLAHGENATLAQWLETLPQEARRARPLLCVYAAMGLLLAGRSEEAVCGHLELARVPEGDAAVLGGRSAVEAALAVLKGRHREAARLCRLALKSLPQEMRFMTMSATTLLGVLSLSLGDLDQAERVFGKLRIDARRSGEGYLEVLSLLRLGRVERARGRPRAALALSDDAIAISRDNSGRLLPMAAYALLERANAQMELGDLQAAASAIGEAEACMHGVPGLAQFSLSALRIQLRLAQGETAAAMVEGRKGLERARGYDVTDLDDRMVEELIARTSLAAGDIQAAEVWAARHPLPQGKVPARRGREVPRLQIEAETLSHARLRIARGEPEAALALLALLAEDALESGHVRLAVAASALSALALEDAGRPLEAHEKLRRALDLSEPQGIAMPFLEEGPAMARLLHDVARSGAAPAWIGRLLSLFPIREQARDASGPSVIEPLSARELEVLRLLAAGQTNKEIADAVFISVRTVKWHAGNIYAKLGVRSRTAAIAKARSLGLLPGS